MAKVLYYDPPSGWMYDFPKEYKPHDGEALVDTLRRDGYPEEEIQRWGGDGPPCRFWQLQNKGEGNDN